MRMKVVCQVQRAEGDADQSSAAPFPANQCIRLPLLFGKFVVMNDDALL